MSKKTKKQMQAEADFLDWMDYEGGFYDFVLCHGVDVPTLGLSNASAAELQAVISAVEVVHGRVRALLNEFQGSVAALEDCA